MRLFIFLAFIFGTSTFADICPEGKVFVSSYTVCKVEGTDELYDPLVFSDIRPKDTSDPKWLEKQISVKIESTYITVCAEASNVVSEITNGYCLEEGSFNHGN